LFKGKIHLSNSTSFLERLFNAKNVFRAVKLEDEGSGKNIYLKKLAHDDELEDLDRKLCEMSKL